VLPSRWAGYLDTLMSILEAICQGTLYQPFDHGRCHFAWGGSGLCLHPLEAIFRTMFLSVGKPVTRASINSVAACMSLSYLDAFTSHHVPTRQATIDPLMTRLMVRRLGEKSLIRAYHITVLPDN
jgi:hypothetical protein